MIEFVNYVCLALHYCLGYVFPESIEGETQLSRERDRDQVGRVRGLPNETSSESSGIHSSLPRLVAAAPYERSADSDE